MKWLSTVNHAWPGRRAGAVLLVVINTWRELRTHAGPVQICDDPDLCPTLGWRGRERDIYPRKVTPNARLSLYVA